MKVKVIPVLEDNYMYLIIDERTREAVVVDVAVPKRLLKIVGREGVSLTTHHHRDQVRGNAELAGLWPGLAVMGTDERICALTHRLVHEEELQFGAIHLRCLLMPGHTSSHLSYFLWEEECLDPPALFSGDTLLVAGCGWCLQGTTLQMYQSLAETLGTLLPETVEGPAPALRAVHSAPVLHLRCKMTEQLRWTGPGAGARASVGAFPHPCLGCTAHTLSTCLLQKALSTH
ncbi:hydroxyacylglutathione hydrolase-like protein [Nycticebus coucang]|uniref:hydroxyacylglutathione hydrolase-like protein n=1 Tax=Nycticebus coucang TaxID=9470 RepID=UPI00234D2BD0|nr:hydroxyacylglutathione hydrolase-like protein [Nycticebus coucang]XP_053411405.1 hydroxyacylglutathione hydrolase-like protein [Nycticebus coucang]